MSKKNIHDKLFKQVFSIAAETETFIRTFLPKAINEVLDTDTLVLENTSFINEQLREYFSDIVWSCRTKNDREVKISLLLEHKSYADPMVPLQLLRYLTEAYDYQLSTYTSDQKGGSARLSLCIPVIVYHGKTRWKPRRLRSLFQLPDERFEKYLPDFATEVIDLRATSDQIIDGIERRGLLRVSFFLLRHFGDAQYVLANRAKFVSFDNQLTAQERDVIFATLMNYVDAAFKLSEEEYMDFGNAMIKEIVRDEAYVPGSMAERWVNQGIKQGMEQGIEQGMNKGVEKGNFLTELRTALKMLPILSDDTVVKLSSTLTNTDLKYVRQTLAKFDSDETTQRLTKKFLAKFELTEKERTQLRAAVEVAKQ